MKKMFLFIVLGLVFIVGCLFAVGSAESAPTIYYNPTTDIVSINTSCDSNGSGWIKDYLDTTAYGAQLERNGLQYDYKCRVRIKAGVFFNDSGKQISYSMTPSGTTDYWMMFWDNSKTRFNDIDFRINYTGAVGFLFFAWNQTASTDTRLYLNNVSFTNNGADTTRLGSILAVVYTNLDMNYVTFRNMYLQRARGNMSHVDFLYRGSGAPILNYNFVSSDDINIYAVPQVFQGIGSNTIYNLKATGVTSYFYFISAGSGNAVFRNCYSNVYTCSIGGSSALSSANIQYGIELLVIDNNNTGIPDVNVNISEYNVADNVRFSYHNLTTDANGRIPLTWVNYSYHANGITQKYFYHHINISNSSFYPVNINDTIDSETNWTIVMVPVPSITIVDNTVNVSGSSDYSWNGSGFTVWNNLSSPLAWFMNIVNASVTHQNQWNGTHQKIWINGSGNTTPIHTSDVKNNVTGSLSYALNSTGYWVTSSHESTLTQFLNLINATGTHQKRWTGTTWNDWANVTGNSSSGGGSSDVFLVHNPNPGNASTVNLLESNPGGLDTGVVVKYQNFTDDASMKQGEHSLVHNNFAPGGHVAQTFTIGTNGTNESQILQNITMRLYRTGFPGLVYINITNVTATGKPGTKVLSSTTFDGDSVPPLEADAKLYNISMPLAVLSPGTMYSLEATKMGVGTFEWMGFGYGGSKYAGGMPYAFLFGSWLSQPTSEMFFSVNYIAGDWNTLLNITYSSNSSSAWVDYGLVHAYENKTYIVHNDNFSSDDERYYWMTETVCNGTLRDNQTWWFETGFSNSTNLTVNENNANVTGGYTTYYSPLTGWFVNNSYVGLNGLSLFENFITAVGTHEFRWNGTHYLVWANVTGLSPNINLMIHNSNPAWNGTTVYDTNYMVNDPGGLATSVDVIYRNFTIPPAVLPGVYSDMIVGSEPLNTPVVWNTSTTGVYADVHDDHTGQLTPGNPYVGQYELAGEYTIMRSFLVFNTSSIPYGAVVNSGYIQLYVYDDVGVVDDFNVTLQQCRQPCPHFPTLSVNDFWNHGFTGDMGHTNTTGYSDDDVFNISLNAFGVADVLGGDWSSTDSVRWALVSDQDDSADAPTADEYMIFYGYGVDVSKHPRLILNYTVPSSNWAYIMNLTASSNSSGAWVDYSVMHANSNGTWTFPVNSNFSVENTVYDWNVSSETVSEGVLSWGSFRFITGNMSSAVNATTVVPIGGGSGVLMMVPLSCVALMGGLLGVRRRRKKI